MLNGSCLCGEITFTVQDGSKSVTACHCVQCRKQSGHLFATGYDSMDNIAVTGTPRWYAASETAKRGFCGTCGSSLFWKAHDEDRMAFALGALNGATGLTLEKHIITAWKGDYYDIADGLPQRED